MQLTPGQIENADDGLYTAKIIAKLLHKLGDDEIQYDQVIEGGMLRWLVGQMDSALVKISHVIQSEPG